MPLQGKPINKKARALTFAIIFLIIIGVPAVLYFMNRNNPVDPNANKVTIDYYKNGVKTTIPESSPLFEGLKSDAANLVTFAQGYDTTLMRDDEAENAKKIEAIEIIFASSQSTSLLSINTNTPSVQYKKLMIIPNFYPSTVNVILGYSDYRAEEVTYNGPWADSFLDNVREAAKTATNSNAVTNTNAGTNTNAAVNSNTTNQ